MTYKQIADLSLNQLAYAVGLAETEKGIYTMDPTRAGFPESLTEQARTAFTNRRPDLDTSKAPPFLQDRHGVLFLWGSGEWQVSYCDDPKTGLPYIFRGPGGEFNPCGMIGVNIIERERIATVPSRRGPMDNSGKAQAPEGWTAWSIHSEDDESEGATFMEAGLRCYLHSFFGDYVDLPDHVK